MPRKNEYGLGESYKIRFEKDQEAQIHSIMALTGEAKADVVRRLLSKGIEMEMTENALGYVLPQVRRAVSESLKPFENRAAALMAKSTISSATTMYTLLEYLGQTGKVEVKDVHKQARKKAVAYTRTPVDLGEDQ
ncbi:hypothetical protein [Paenibacillus campinasensis]|uniref:Uncharacterized protein n=1 Tax=Paenibacillus campinasensis TaxID=66347 RepID=A0A268EE04_9BACL|nr:hypothetical protein [Paenibacillus campinasensis]PAD71355.1 hypothetical protein CHH67_24735 [Paenibacillus campinasensis]